MKAAGTVLLNGIVFSDDMIPFKEKPNTQKDVEALLHPIVRQWFFSTFKEFSRAELVVGTGVIPVLLSIVL